jgi:hypothetical protein
VNDGADFLRIAGAFWGQYGASALDRLPHTMAAAFTEANVAHRPDLVARQADVENRWEQMHEAREQREARLAPSRSRGWAAYQAARAEFGVEAPAASAGPRMSMDARWWR